MPFSAVSLSDGDAKLRGGVKALKVHIRASRAIPYGNSCVVIWHVVSFGQNGTYRPDAGTGPHSEKRISSRGLTIGLHWPIAPQSPQTIEQDRWFQPVGEIFINKGQTNRSILREQKRGWHRQLP